MTRKEPTVAAGLSSKQKAFIEALAAGATDVSAALEKHGVSRQLYRQWLARPAFADELAFRRDCAQQQSRMILARFAPAAAARLVALTDSEKEETARRACLDILALAGKLELPGRGDEDDVSESDRQQVGTDLPEITPATAAKMLALLAEQGD